MPIINSDERNQAFGMLIAVTSATVVSRYFGCTRKTVDRLRRRYRFTGNVADRPARRDWCRRHLHFRRADWDFILFSNECWFNLSHADGRERVYRRRGERFLASLSWAFSEFSLSLGWDNIQRYVNSMHHRITACTAQNGGHMRY